jgi:hypothetical protein
MGIGGQVCMLARIEIKTRLHSLVVDGWPLNGGQRAKTCKEESRDGIRKQKKAPNHARYSLVLCCRILPRALTLLVCCCSAASSEQRDAGRFSVRISEKRCGPSQGICNGSQEEKLTCSWDRHWFIKLNWVLTTNDRQAKSSSNVTRLRRMAC